MKALNLLPSKEVLLYYFYYDRDNGKLYWKNKTNNRCKIGEEAGWVTDKGYRGIRIKGQVTSAHRIIYFLETGEQPGEVDHIDKNTLNNYYKNLRNGDEGINQNNTNIRKDNKSGVKNINWHKGKYQWQVQVMKDKKTKYIGSYNDFNDAIKALEEYKNNN